MQPYKRSVRVGDLIKEEVADIIMNKVKHKSLGFITVTGANVSDDLRSATIYVSVLKTEEGDRTVSKLNALGPFIKGELAKRLTMRFVPSLRFKIDEAIKYGMKIDKLLDDIESGKAIQGDDEDLF
ncbi:MAG TPA: 30S ribosome-binding factor RbfA [Nitrospirae bacterium]|nr:30S ribosome-binding factor RbfA [Nitrospirota bacterium]HDN94925.1 30S ribosome-binding factor RbfA [Nitrospirota bacterium]